VTDASDSPLALAVRWLTQIRTTLVFCTVLTFVYLGELLVWTLWGFETFTWLFVANGTPSPAWLLAGFAHSPVEPMHLLGNLALLAVFGGMAERRLSRWEYVAFVLMAMYASTAAQVASYGLVAPDSGTVGVFGASGVALGATAFAVTSALEEKAVTGRWRGETSWLWTVLGGAIVVQRLLRDFALGVPNVGEFGHLGGILVGIAWALWRQGPIGESQ
jgi:membrane associated rhomboid family serine protease